MTFTFASDTFSGRTVVGGLGTASDTINTWQTPFSNSKSVTSVGSGEANVYYDNSGGGSGTYGAMCGVGFVRDVDVSVRFSFLSLTGTTLFRLIGRATSNFNYYAAEVFGSHIWFAKSVSGSITRTSVASITITAGVYYHIRFKCTGSSFSITVWQDGTTEPAPQWTGTDSTFTTPGAYGLLALATGTAANTGVNFDSFLAQSLSSQLTDIYVATTGNNSNPGTISSPLATIQAGLDLAVPTSTVHVGNGVVSSTNVTCNASGTDANHRITIQSTVQFGAKVGPTGAQYPFLVNGSYVDVWGFEVAGDSIANRGIAFFATGCTAKQNYVHDIQSPFSLYPTGGAGIVGVGQPATNLVCDSNFIVNTGTLDDLTRNLVQPIYLQSNGCVATNNIIVGSYSSGISAFHYANNITITNNLIANTYEGILIGGSDGGTTCDNSIVANNTFYWYGSVWQLHLFLGGTYNVVVEESSTGIHNQYKNNVVWGPSASYVFTLQNGLVATGTIHADPLFVNYKDDGTGNYRVTDTSPCIDAGTSTGAPSIDYSGLSRPQELMDIGPYEFVHYALFPPISRRSGLMPSVSRRHSA